jgi:hypothetical protein
MIEGVLMDLVDATKETEGLGQAPSELRGSPLDKARNFFKKVALLRFPDETQTWVKLKALFELRHAIVHTWGKIGDERRKKTVESLHGVIVSQGRANLDASTVDEALRVMRKFADELETHLGPQDPAAGT